MPYLFYLLLVARSLGRVAKARQARADARTRGRTASLSGRTPVLLGEGRYTPGGRRYTPGGSHPSWGRAHPSRGGLHPSWGSGSPSPHRPSESTWPTQKPGLSLIQVWKTFHLFWPEVLSSLTSSFPAEKNSLPSYTTSPLGEYCVSSTTSMSPLIATCFAVASRVPDAWSRASAP